MHVCAQYWIFFFRFFFFKLQLLLHYCDILVALLQNNVFLFIFVACWCLNATANNIVTVSGLLAAVVIGVILGVFLGLCLLGLVLVCKR